MVKRVKVSNNVIRRLPRYLRKLESGACRVTFGSWTNCRKTGSTEFLPLNLGSSSA